MAVSKPQPIYTIVNSSHGLSMFPIICDITWFKDLFGTRWPTETKLPLVGVSFQTGDGAIVDKAFRAITGESLGLVAGMVGRISTGSELTYGVGMRISNPLNNAVVEAPVRLVVRNVDGDVHETFDIHDSQFIGAYSRTEPIGSVELMSKVNLCVSGIVLRQSQTELPEHTAARARKAVRKAGDKPADMKDDDSLSTGPAIVVAQQDVQKHPQQSAAAPAPAPPEKVDHKATMSSEYGAHVQRMNLDRARIDSEYARFQLDRKTFEAERTQFATLSAPLKAENQRLVVLRAALDAQKAALAHEKQKLEAAWAEIDAHKKMIASKQSPTTAVLAPLCSKCNGVTTVNAQDKKQIGSVQSAYGSAGSAGSAALASMVVSIPLMVSVGSHRLVSDLGSWEAHAKESLCSLEKLPIHLDALSGEPLVNTTYMRSFEIKGFTFPSDSLLVTTVPPRFVVARNIYFSIECPSLTRGIGLKIINGPANKGVACQLLVNLSDGTGATHSLDGRLPWTGILTNNSQTTIRNVTLVTNSQVMWLTDWVFASQ